MEEKKQSAIGHSIELDIFSNLRKIIKAVDIYSVMLRQTSGLNSSQLSCLLVLSNTGPLSLTQLSRKVSLSPSMMTGIVDQLEHKGYIQRERSSSDRRVTLIKLNEKGQQTVKEAPTSFQKSLMNGLAKLKETEKGEINKNLLKLLSVIVAEVFIDSSITGAEDKLVEVEPSVLSTEYK